MVERRCDKSSICGRMMSSIERSLFNGLKEALQVAEAPLTSPSIRYSWDNARQDHNRIMARLDRCYVFKDAALEFSHVLEYRIRGDHTRSDHSPVSMIIELEQSPSRPSRWILSSSHLDEVDPIIRQLWQSTPTHAIFFSKLRRVTRFYRGFYINRAKTSRKAEEALCNSLDLKTQQLQTDPLSVQLQEETNVIRSTLASFENKKIEGQKLRSRARWRLCGDHLSTEFLKTVHEGPSNTTITELRDTNDIIQHGRSELERVCTEFYTRLYS